MMNLRKLTIAAAGTALVLGATACGTQGTTNGSPQQAPAQTAAPAADGNSSADAYGNGPDSGTEAAAGTASGPLAVRDDATLGPLVADAAGFTLYRFDKDTADPSSSACAGDCAKAWPPVPASATKPGGVDAAKIGSVERADGTEQLTIAGWPVYRFAKDTAPGQTNGQGVGGTWFAVTPDGKKAGVKEAAEPLPDLSLADDAKLGKIIRDGKGRTLYRFTKDTAWPMKSNCEGACLEKWRPAKLVDLNDVEGIDPKKLITYTRSDGTKQLTIDCWPLYWFTGDKTPGDTDGQGVGGTWFAVTANGKLAK
ncbi:SCO0930 family lipoprotein [Streptomyces sp. NPDC006553]|uniref:SCO0930 family lipoprotein n=1 Tax=unclassified Streptomyces TaxID=2593676 RepID=UPI0022565064|nr:SCO0930 family lipoprotein [Streptomyces sp. NBC_00233]MCX5231530.1 SCO0930 family lipoprotein [Streptomyces sp. NBC_00233]